MTHPLVPTCGWQQAACNLCREWESQFGPFASVQLWTAFLLPTVRLTSIDHPQIEGKFTATVELVNATIKYNMAPLEVGSGFALN